MWRHEQEDDDYGQSKDIDFQDFGNFNKFVGQCLTQASQEDYGQHRPSNKQSSPQNGKTHKPVQAESLQANGFNDDFLNFDLLGDVVAILKRTTARSRPLVQTRKEVSSTS